MQTFSTSIHFPTSRSKNFDKAVKLAQNFDGFKPGPVNIVNVNIKEVFEKWDYFNLLFWATVDWKGTILEIDGMKFHSHSDKTRIFYALQHSHSSYICFLEAKYQQLHKVESGELKLEELADYVYTDKDMNTLIDTFQIRKQEEEVKRDYSLQNIKVKDRPWFLQNRMTPEDVE
jgi:hypothetical protein